MRTCDVFIRLFDLVFPPSAELQVVRALTPSDVAYLFCEQKIGGVIVLSDFHDSKVRALIHEAKFHGNEHAFTLLGRLFLMHMEYSRPTYDYIVPIPLSRTRRRSRGYNQVHEVLCHAAQNTSLPIDESLLKRLRNTRPQTDLSKKDRLINLHDAFRVSDPQRISGKKILLIDDVMTTGATLRAAQTALLSHHPASVTLLALAH